MWNLKDITKHWCFKFSISSSNEYSGLISFSGLMSLQSKRLSRVFSKYTVLNINSSALSLLYGPTLTSIHDCWKTIALTRWTFVGKVMSLLFNMLSRFVIAFLSRSNQLLFSWLQSPSNSDFGAQGNNVWHCFHCFPFYLPWSDVLLPGESHGWRSLAGCSPWGL